MKKDNSNYIFLKPFEVYTTFTPIISSWTILSKRMKNISSLREASLLRAISSEAKYGFVSVSVWATKDSFRKAISEDELLKVHYSSNGNKAASGMQNLYKTMFEEKVSAVGKGRRETILMFFKPDKADNESILRKARSICEKLSSFNMKFDIILMKSIYTKNRIGHIILLNYENKDKIRFFVLELLERISRRKNREYFSVYKTESYINTKLF